MVRRGATDPLRKAIPIADGNYGKISAMSEGTKQRAAGDILLADDEPVVRKTYRALFEGEGYSVRTARNGEEAVAMFAERRPDLVLLDVMMPRKSGTAACAEMRRTDPLVPILFFTAMPIATTLFSSLVPCRNRVTSSACILNSTSSTATCPSNMTTPSLRR